MKVYKTNFGEIHLVFDEGAADFRILQSFLAAQQKTAGDASLKMLLGDLISGIKTAAVIQENLVNKTVPAQTSPVMRQASSGVADKVGLLSKKIDLLISSLGHMDNVSSKSNAKMKLEDESLDLIAKRLENVLSNTILNQVEAGTQASSLLQDTFNGIKNLEKVIEKMQSVVIKGDITIPTSAEMTTEVKDTVDRAQVRKTTLKEKNDTQTSKEEKKVEIEAPEKNEEEVFVADDEIVRYPVKRGRKKVKPKCFGKFIEEGKGADLCSSCIWVNNCSSEQTNKSDKVEKEEGRKSCFGSFNHDFVCSNCKDKDECMDKS